MERLTKRLDDGKKLCIEACEKECTEGHCECHKCEPFVDVLKRLAEYEDTELTTGQIAELDKLYLAKCEEVNQLRAELERLKGKSSGAQGDLISKSDLLESLNDWIDENTTINDLLRWISEYEASYSIEKVVEQLDDIRDMHKRLSLSEDLSAEDRHIHTLLQGLSIKAINIVRAGGKE